MTFSWSNLILRQTKLRLWRLPLGASMDHIKFISPTTKTERTMVEIRFPDLNLVFYNESVLMAIGTPIKVEKYTLDVMGSCFARVYVEIDLFYFIF